MKKLQGSYDLGPLGVITVAGAEAEEFLSAQLTSDVSVVKSGRHQLTAWCNPQGRIRCLARLFLWEGVFCLLLPRTQIEATLKRLEMFVLRSAVKLADASNDLYPYGLSNLAVEPLVELSVPKPDHLSSSKDMVVIAIGGAVSVGTRFILITRKRLDKLSLSASYDDWRCLDIVSRLPSVVPQTMEMFLPQMLDLEALGGLSFQKGCFPGQEIIARLHYRGELKRHMYVATAVTNRLPEPGEPLFASDENRETVGNIIDACWHENGQAALLAVIKVENAKSADIHLHSAGGPAVSLAKVH